MKNYINRRTFIKVTGYSSLAVLVPYTAFAAEVKMASPTEGLGKGLGYKEVAVDKKKKCSACNFYKNAKAPHIRIWVLLIR